MRNVLKRSAEEENVRESFFIIIAEQLVEFRILQRKIGENDALTTRGERIGEQDRARRSPAVTLGARANRYQHYRSGRARPFQECFNS